jgi:hypothetical protein
VVTTGAASWASVLNAAERNGSYGVRSRLHSLFRTVGRVEDWPADLSAPSRLVRRIVTADEIPFADGAIDGQRPLRYVGGQRALRAVYVVMGSAVDDGR